MELPKFDIPIETIHGVTVKGLSRAQVLTLVADGFDEVTDLVEREVRILAVAFDQVADDVRVWYHNTPAQITQDIVAKLTELSGMGERGNAASTPSPEDSPPA